MLRGTLSSDYYAMCAVFIDDIYKIEEINSPSVILDIGANIGTFTILAAKKFPHAKIIAVEPEPDNIEMLKKNIELNQIKNVEIRNVAVSSGYGMAKFYIDKDQPSAHTLHGDPNDKNRESIEVKTVPLSDFGRIDAVKIDCEGAEVQILDGNIPDCQFVAVEFDTEDKHRIIKQFEDYGYRIVSGNSTNVIFIK